jgi:hypothetical protein
LRLSREKDKMTTIGVSIEMDLTIQSEGIVPRFLAWVESNREYDEIGGGPITGECDNQPGPFDPDRVNVYEANGQWLVAIPKIPFKPELKDNILYVHIYSNIPMVTFHEDFGAFLKALGVEKFEAPDKRYLECVRQAVEFLGRGEAK